MTITNNVTRFLDSRKVKYSAHEVPAEKLGAVEVAQLMGAPARQVFKTIVTKREKGKPVLAVIPAPHAKTHSARCSPVPVRLSSITHPRGSATRSSFSSSVTGSGLGP